MNSQASISLSRVRFLWRSLGDFVKSMWLLRSSRPCITVFGSARIREGEPAYQMARSLGNALGHKGFTIMTGGGPGLMEAVNRGAREAGSRSVGCRINFTFNEPPNRYLDQCSTVRYFFVRKVVMCTPASGFAVLPGGIGTLDELFEILVLIQTKRMTPKPIVLLGSDYWRPLLSLLKEMALAGTIAATDVNLMRITDDVNYAAAFLSKPTASVFERPKPRTSARERAQQASAK